MKRYILALAFIVPTMINLQSQIRTLDKKYNKTIENELTMLKDQLFINLYYKSLAIVGGNITPPDGSNYIQISDLTIKYARDENADRLIKRWVEKKYKSYNPKQNLYLMRCLDFYNSNDLKLYIDSVRQIELKR